MATRETVIIVAVLGVLSAVFVLFMVGVTRALDPYPDRDADLRRFAAIQREEDVKPQYDNNDTAIVTLREGQKSGPVICKEITLFGEVKIDLIRADRITGTDVVPITVGEGEVVSSCEYPEVRLLNVTADTATFKFVKSGICPGGYCWHMYQPEIYDNYIATLSAG